MGVSSGRGRGPSWMGAGPMVRGAGSSGVGGAGVEAGGAEGSPCLPSPTSQRVSGSRDPSCERRLAAAKGGVEFLGTLFFIFQTS